jgi:hypothetical protein
VINFTVSSIHPSAGSLGTHWTRALDPVPIDYRGDRVKNEEPGIELGRCFVDDHNTDCSIKVPVSPA